MEDNHSCKISFFLCYAATFPLMWYILCEIFPSVIQLSLILYNLIFLFYVCNILYLFSFVVRCCNFDTSVSRTIVEQWLLNDVYSFDQIFIRFIDSDKLKKYINYQKFWTRLCWPKSIKSEIYQGFTFSPCRTDLMSKISGSKILQSSIFGN